MRRHNGTRCLRFALARVAGIVDTGILRVDPERKRQRARASGGDRRTHCDGEGLDEDTGTDDNPFSRQRAASPVLDQQWS